MRRIFLAPPIIHQVALLACLLLPGIGFAHASDVLATPASHLRYVDAADGISAAEANDIAEAYFLKHVGCGSYVGISDGIDAWVVNGQFGYAGEPIKDFRIDKKTGAIASSIGPSYEHPGDMLEGSSEPGT